MTHSIIYMNVPFFFFFFKVTIKTWYNWHFLDRNVLLQGLAAKEAFYDYNQSCKRVYASISFLESNSDRGEKTP